MPSILTSPPALEPVSLAEAKAHLRLAHADEDTVISTLIVAARRHVEAQTALKLVSQGWSHFRDDWPEDGEVTLPLYPLLAVGDVKTWSDEGVSAVVDPAHYYANTASRPPRILLRGSRVWARPGRIGNGIEIAVTAGFGTTAASVPEDIREAILQLVAHWYGNRGEIREENMPLTVITVMQRYREVRL
jgi:uncharacterized phiE125 gp8 family phage protein